MPVEKYRNLFHCDQSFPNHFIEFRQEAVNFFFGIHDFDDDRQILRQPEDFGGVNPAIGSKTGKPFNDSASG